MSDDPAFDADRALGKSAVSSEWAKDVWGHVQALMGTTLRRRKLNRSTEREERERLARLVAQRWRGLHDAIFNATEDAYERSIGTVRDEAGNIIPHSSRGRSL